MKTRKYFFIPCILVIVISISISRCKTPVETKEILTDTSIVALIDTVAQADTTKIVAATTKTTVSVDIPPAPLTIIVNDLASPSAPLVVGVYNSQYKLFFTVHIIENISPSDRLIQR